MSSHHHHHHFQPKIIDGNYTDCQSSRNSFLGGSWCLVRSFITNALSSMLIACRLNSLIKNFSTFSSRSSSSPPPPSLSSSSSIDECSVFSLSPKYCFESSNDSISTKSTRSSNRLSNFTWEEEIRRRRNSSQAIKTERIEKNDSFYEPKAEIDSEKFQSSYTMANPKRTPFKVTEKDLTYLNHKIEKLLVKLEEEYETEIATSPEDECVICINAKATMQTFPCGHRVVCRKCFVRTIQMVVTERKLPLRCVICRAKVLRLKQNTVQTGLTNGSSAYIRSKSKNILQPSLTNKQVEQNHRVNSLRMKLLSRPLASPYYEYPKSFSASINCFENKMVNFDFSKMMMSMRFPQIDRKRFDLINLVYPNSRILLAQDSDTRYDQLSPIDLDRDDNINILVAPNSLPLSPSSISLDGLDVNRKRKQHTGHLQHSWRSSSFEQLPPKFLSRTNDAQPSSTGKQSFGREKRHISRYTDRSLSKLEKTENQKKQYKNHIESLVGFKSFINNEKLVPIVEIDDNDQEQEQILDSNDSLNFDYIEKQRKFQLDTIDRSMEKLPYQSFSSFFHKDCSRSKNSQCSSKKQLNGQASKKNFQNKSQISRIKKSFSESYLVVKKSKNCQKLLIDNNEESNNDDDETDDEQNLGKTLNLPKTRKKSYRSHNDYKRMVAKKTRARSLTSLLQRSWSKLF